MDCSICTTMPFILRPPRNTICAACYEGARSLITLTNKLDSTTTAAAADKAGIDKSTCCNTTTTTTITSVSSSPNSSSKGFSNALKWVKEMKDVEEELNERLTFLGGFASSYRDQIHTDIQVKPGRGRGRDNGTTTDIPIPAHRALLAARSDVFKNMLDSDGYCKAPPNDGTVITLAELSYEEVESLLEFLYSGTLPREKAEKHVYSLSIAADKYDIPFLQMFCEHRMLGSLNPSNALDVLEISDLCANQSLKETALNFIVRNMEDVVFSARFDAFALKNPHLTVQITRASFIDIRNRRN